MCAIVVRRGVPIKAYVLEYETSRELQLKKQRRPTKPRRPASPRRRQRLGRSLRWGDTCSPRFCAALAFLFPEGLYHLVGRDWVWEGRRNPRVSAIVKLSNGGVGSEITKEPRRKKERDKKGKKNKRTECKTRSKEDTRKNVWKGHKSFSNCN